MSQENNTIEIDVQLEKVTHTYTPPIEEPTIELTEAEKRALYEAEVVRLIRLQYSQDDENAIIRKYLANPSESSDEFTQYHSYAESCKVTARELID